MNGNVLIFEEDWRTQHLTNDLVTRARKGLVDLLDMIERIIPKLVTPSQRDSVFPVDLAVRLLVGINTPAMTVPEIEKIFRRFSHEQILWSKKKALDVFVRERYIAKPEIEALQDLFWNLVERSRLPMTALNNIAPEWRTKFAVAITELPKMREEAA